ncbi:hypothetical protein IQ256_26450 [cf. Phormidesmis sp. LEGE 11477]|nr:hypothetical protein [cf. Phormidesmis sp. LEGE 11477]
MPFERMGDRTSTAYQYIELQTTETYQEPVEDEGYLIRLFSALIVPFVLFALLLWLLKRSQKMFMEQADRANENAEAVRLNNELLREQIELQREILEVLRKQVR